MRPMLADPSTLLDDVRRGLGATPKRLPPVWFYDKEGSRLFEEITRQPEYYPTRVEQALLARHGRAILAAAGGPTHFIELGAGSAAKTVTLLRAASPRSWYSGIDVSADALQAAAKNVQRDAPGICFEAVVGRNRPALRLVPRRGARLLLHLGSSIGNLEPDEAAAWLGDVVAMMEPQDRLLLGLDRAKDPAVLQAAYNDAAGVTAAFNLNLLIRLNRELGAGFDPEGFQHLALFDARHHRIEMHLRSLRDQTVTIPEAGTYRFLAGETLHTENSHKYTDAMKSRLAASCGAREVASWSDEELPYDLLLLERQPA